MRLKKEIEALTKKADSVEFPQPVSVNWEHFKSNLKKVIYENLNIRGEKIAWDEYGQKFYFRLSEAVDLGDFRCGVAHTFDLDPSKDIMSELERLQDEISRWKSTIGHAAALLYQERVKASVESGDDLPKTPMGLCLGDE